MGRRVVLFSLGFPIKDTLNLDLLFNFIILLRNETCTIYKVVDTGSARAPAFLCLRLVTGSWSALSGRFREKLCHVTLSSSTSIHH